MLTNILLITLLIVLISGIVYIRWFVQDRYISIFTKMELINDKTIKQIRDSEIENGKLIVNSRSFVKENQRLLVELTERYTQRIEAQEKLIADLQATQAPEEVVETVNLISEWLTGPSDN